MSLETIRFIRCDGYKCSQSAELYFSAAHGRGLLKKQGWKRFRRDGFIIDLCDWCQKPSSLNGKRKE